MIKRVILMLILSNSLSSCVVNERDSLSSQDNIIGSWEVKEIRWITADTAFIIERPQTGLLMVDSKRYSFMWTPTEEPRIPFEKLAHPTNEEILTGFRSIVFNAGTYNIKDSIFNIKASIAKVPGFEGGTQKFKYNIEKDTLVLKMIDETYPSGEKPDWYGQVKTRFTLLRIKE